jgi:hypothetical protein
VAGAAIRVNWRAPCGKAGVATAKAAKTLAFKTLITNPYLYAAHFTLLRLIAETD